METHAIPKLHCRPDLAGDRCGVLFTASPCRSAYKKVQPITWDKLEPLLLRQWERIASLGGFKPRPLPAIESNGPRVWADGICFSANFWNVATKKATAWMPDPQDPRRRASYFFGKTGAVVAIAMPCIGEERPNVVPVEEYEKHGLDCSHLTAQEWFSLPWQRFTPVDKYEQKATGRVVMVPVGSTVADTLAKYSETRAWSTDGWERVTPVEQKCPIFIGQIVPGAPINTLTRLEWRLRLWFSAQSERVRRRSSMMPLESLRRIVSNPTLAEAFGHVFCNAAGERIQKEDAALCGV